MTLRQTPIGAPQGTALPSGVTGFARPGAFGAAPAGRFPFLRVFPYSKSSGAFF